MSFFKWGLIILLMYLTGSLVFGTHFLFIDYFNLVMHEAGHWVFMLFGSTISFLGGTLMQLLIPLICGLVLVIQQQDWFGGGVCLWWLGENLVNVGQYMADAPYQLLPLIGGEHDWVRLFNQWSMLGQADLIGQFVQQLGFVIMVLAIIFLIFQLLTHQNQNRNF